jgi:hypothetical protein
MAAFGERLEDQADRANHSADRAASAWSGCRPPDIAAGHPAWATVQGGLTEESHDQSEGSSAFIAAAKAKANEIGQAHEYRRDRWRWQFGEPCPDGRAFMARAFHISTAQLSENASQASSSNGIQNSNRWRVMIFAGGVSLRCNRSVVSGSGKQDQSVATTGASAIVDDVVDTKVA